MVLLTTINMGFYKNAGGMSHPTTKRELVKEINIRLDRGQTNLNDIDTSMITDMSALLFNFNRNIDISLWDVSNVRDMSYMFYGCDKLNCDLSRWNTGKVERMDCMFCSCQNFNSDLSKWNVSNVKNMDCMFLNCTSFNCDLSKWNTSSVTSTRNMFYYCLKFDCDLSGWNTSNVECMKNMFDNSGVKELPKWFYFK